MLKKGIIATPQKVDMALIYSFGFPPFRRDVFHYLDTIKLTNYVQITNKLINLGAIYYVPQGLCDKAFNDTSYFDVQQQPVLLLK
ncbi:hypothetical protein [Candidatus Enterovibrio altilux]|uniref:hypothetical protein n=1 Tax=Candidatus Enterovibrio altilux TaxID=1927128 RepID=UPI001CC23C26|nr:hypothetical protein [Candidatus Enterovibrio luxaltus]